MRSLLSKPNVEAPSGDYPYGRIRDDNGTGNGTPVDEQVYGDIHQFFERMFTYAGITANDLPDNISNGFESLDVLLSTVSLRVGFNTSTDFNTYLNAGIFKVSSSFTNDPSGLSTSAQLFVCGAGNDVLQRLIDLTNGAEWTRAYTGSWSAWTLIKLAEKTIELGDWNMDTTNSITVDLDAAGIVVANIRKINAAIRADVDAFIPSAMYFLNFGNDTGSTVWLSSAFGTSPSAIITLVRLAGSGFDGTDFDATSYNRGWITVSYIP